ncbi:hypothetical protein BDW71DRAFT_183578 [Aspergillus fruticulosus]
MCLLTRPWNTRKSRLPPSNSANTQADLPGSPSSPVGREPFPIISEINHISPTNPNLLQTLKIHIPSKAKPTPWAALLDTLPTNANGLRNIHITFDGPEVVMLGDWVIVCLLREH